LNISNQKASDFPSKRVIIIGATSGIGRQLALLLAKENYRVGITGRRKELLEALAAEQPDHFIIADFDVTNTAGIALQLNNLVHQLGGLDLLILSAGTGDLNEHLDFDIEKQTLDVNVLGFTAVADWTVNYFQQQGSGHLAAITSLAGMLANGQAPAYNASKAFQINYLRGLRLKLNKLKKPVYITDLRPGFVNTAMAKGEGHFWVAPVEKAAKQIIQAIQHKKKVAYITRRWRLVAFILRMI
jgi:short-subunit dehydrogenase